MGWKSYSRGDYADLPTDDLDLENTYTGLDLLNIASEDVSWVLQPATDSYTIHQYKDYIAVNRVTLTWIGQSNIAPSIANVVLEIYKYAEPAGWEARATKSDGLADIDFTLTADILSLTDYKNPSGIVTCRVYQFATAG